MYRVPQAHVINTKASPKHLEKQSCSPIYHVSLEAKLLDNSFCISQLHMGVSKHRGPQNKSQVIILSCPSVKPRILKLLSFYFAGEPSRQLPYPPARSLSARPPGSSCISSMQALNNIRTARTPVASPFHWRPSHRTNEGPEPR